MLFLNDFFYIKFFFKWFRVVQKRGLALKFSFLFNKSLFNFFINSFFLFNFLISMILSYNLPFSFHLRRYGKVFLQIPLILKFWLFFLNSWKFFSLKIANVYSIFNVDKIEDKGVNDSDFFDNSFFRDSSMVESIDNYVDLFERGYDRMKVTYKKRRFKKRLRTDFRVLKYLNLKKNKKIIY